MVVSARYSTLLVRTKKESITSKLKRREYILPENSEKESM